MTFAISAFFLRSARWLGIACLLFVPGVVWAQISVEQPATDRVFNPVFSVDRGAARQLDIWSGEFVSYSGREPVSYAAYCRSEDDPVTGACPTQDSPTMPTLIRLRFRERRTGVTAELIAAATRRNEWAIDPNEFVESGIAHITHDSHQNTNTTFTLLIAPSEIDKLPIGGLWESTLNLRLVRDVGETEPPMRIAAGEATWIVNTTIQLRDKPNIQVYLPEFADAAPVVDLALRGRPPASGPGSMLYGNRVIDACLYDGFNAQSEQYDIRVVDPASADSTLYVRHTDPQQPGSSSERIAYEVWAPDPSSGTPQRFLSGQSYSFGGIGAAEWRLVRIPFSSLPVVCTPWPITLVTPEFSSADKRAGRYVGQLQILFSPLITAP